MKKTKKQLFLEKIEDFQLDEYEREILEGVEKNGWKSVPNLEEEKEKAFLAAQYTLHTLSKKKNINLRLYEVDIQKLKEKAMKTGIPYQTLASSLLHRYVNDEITVIM